MKKFLESFSKVVKQENKLILAISGGVDSMVLFDLVRKHHPEKKIIVAHFDHSLRGDESDGDREFIANFCRENMLQFEVRKLGISALSKQEKMSIEHVARKYRYEFFDEIATKYEAKYILTAHHADDRIETAMFNLIRGTKLGGVHALSKLSGTIFRPFFDVSKEEIRKYAEDHLLVFREDSTNSDMNFQRNYLRNEVLPKFKTINREYRRALSHFIDYTEELKSWIDTEIVKFLRGKPEFSVIEFEKQTPFFQKEIIRFLYEQANNGTIGLSEGNMDELLRFIKSANGGTVKEIGSLHLSKKSNRIIFGDLSKF